MAKRKIAVRRKSQGDGAAAIAKAGLAKLKQAKAGGQDPYEAAADALAAARQHRPQRPPRIVPWRTGGE